MFIIELAANQVMNYAIPLIRDCMGDELGDRAESEWMGEDTLESGVYAIIDSLGLVGIGAIGAEISKRKVWLGYLAVRPESRGSGIGRLLLNHVESIARSRGYSEVYVETYNKQEFDTARYLYKSCGYKEVGYLLDYLDDGTDVCYLRKVL